MNITGAYIHGADITVSHGDSLRGSTLVDTRIVQDGGAIEGNVMHNSEVVMHGDRVVRFGQRDEDLRTPPPAPQEQENQS